MCRVREQIPEFLIWELMPGPRSIRVVLTIVEDNLVDTVLEKIKKIDSINEEVGIRAFVWDVLKTV